MGPTLYKYDLGLVRPGVSTSSLMITTHTIVALHFAVLFFHGTLVTLQYSEMGCEFPRTFDAKMERLARLP